MVFEKNANFSPKIGKKSHENCDHDIDPWMRVKFLSAAKKAAKSEPKKLTKKFHR
jgi:hypothetical protein